MRAIRYVRDTANGSPEGADSYWQEFRIFGPGNVALSNAATYTTPNFIVGGALDAPTMNDASGSGAEISAEATPVAGAVSVLCDLGSVQQVEFVRILRFDGTTFNETKTEASVDGVTWFTLRDSAVSGTYAEAMPGLDMPVPDAPGLNHMFLVF